MQLFAHLRFKLHCLGNQVQEAAILDELAMRNDHIFGEALGHLLVEVQVMVTLFLVCSRIALKHVWIAYQRQLLRQVTIDVSEFGDYENWKLRLAQNVVFYFWVRHGLLDHQKENLAQSCRVFRHFFVIVHDVQPQHYLKWHVVKTFLPARSGYLIGKEHLGDVWRIVGDFHRQLCKEVEEDLFVCLLHVDHDFHFILQ